MAGNNKRSQLFHKLTPEQHRYVIDGLEKLWAEAFENPDASLQEIRPLFLLLQQAKREYQQRAGVPTGWYASTLLILTLGLLQQKEQRPNLLQARVRILECFGPEFF